MADVILDENVYIRALEAECTEDVGDLRAARLVAHVQEKHRWIFTDEVVSAYLHQFSRIQCKGSATTRLMKSLTEAYNSQASFELIDRAPTIPGEYDRQDQHVVAAAAARSGSLLLTLDARLRRDLVAAGITEAFDFQVVDVVEAESLLG